MTDSPANSMETLIEQLASKEVRQRAEARLRLARIGRPAVKALTAALSDPQQHVRWEAAKTLVAIADPSSIPALVDALQDPDHDVRWVAGEALVGMGEEVIEPILRRLLVKADDPLGLYETAHQVLHALNTERLRPVLAPVLHALKHGDPEIKVPMAAREALDSPNSPL